MSPIGVEMADVGGTLGLHSVFIRCEMCEFGIRDTKFGVVWTR